MWRRVLARFPKYIRRFGFWQGFRLLIDIERNLPTKSSARRERRIREFAAPIHLRESRPDHGTFWQVVVAQQYDLDHFPQMPDVMRNYRRLLEDGKRPVIVDGGGNIGLAAMWFAERFPEAAICSVEPEAENFELLLRNTGAYGNVTALRGALWSESARLRIENPESGAAAFRVTDVDACQVTEGSGGHEEDGLDAMTIDQIVARIPEGTLFLVKLDIEGAQAKLFQGECSWVAQCHVIVIELDDWQMPWQGTSTAFFACVGQHQYDYLLNGENLVCFRHVDPVSP